MPERKKGYELCKRIQAVSDRLDGFPNSIDNNEAIRELANIVSDLVFDVYYLPEHKQSESA
jgi:hypothetical protein